MTQVNRRRWRHGSELPAATLLNISRRGRQNHFYDRRLVLERRRESRHASGAGAHTSAEA